MENMILVSSRADKRKCAKNNGVWRDRDREVVVGVVVPSADRDAGLGALHPFLPLVLVHNIQYISATTFCHSFIYFVSCGSRLVFLLQAKPEQPNCGHITQTGDCQNRDNCGIVGESAFNAS